MILPGSVLILDENAPVPLDRRVWMEACALRDAGYHVTVVSPRTATFASPRESLEGVDLWRHPLPAEPHSPAGYALEYSAALWWESVLALAADRYRRLDIVHICNPPDILFLAAGLPKLLHGAALVFDHHDLSPELYEAKYGRRGLVYRGLVLAERATFAAADVVISTNESYREVALGRGRKQPEDVFIVRNAPDLSRFTAADSAPESQSRQHHVVGYAGTIGGQDGVDHLLRVASRVTRELGRSDVRFRIIGDGPALAELRRMAHGMDLDASVEFVGLVTDQGRLATLLSECDVCVSPDPKTPYNDASTMTKVMDYMALRKPIVQFDLLEGRRSAGDASLYAATDEDFADKIVALLDDPAARERMGAVGRQRMETMLDWRLQVPNLLAAYDRATEIARRRRLRRGSLRPRRRVGGQQTRWHQ